jgi:hypothetical protein
VSTVGGDADRVVDVQQPPHRAPEHLFMVASGQGQDTGSGLQVGPALAAVVYVVEIESGLVQKSGQVDLRNRLTERAKLVHLRRPARRNRIPEATKDDLRRLPVELHVAAGRKEGELLLHGLFDIPP